MDKKTTMAINAVIFAVIGLLQLARFARACPAVIGNVEIPRVASLIAAIVAFVMVWLNWKYR